MRGGGAWVTAGPSSWCTSFARIAALAGQFGFDLPGGAFHRHADAVFGQVNLGGAQAQHGGDFGDAHILKHATIEHLAMLWIDALANTRQRHLENVLAPFLFPIAVDAGVRCRLRRWHMDGRQHRVTRFRLCLRTRAVDAPELILNSPAADEQ
jgi:hypothetical protein